jgi:hypothetical protein
MVNETGSLYGNLAEGATDGLVQKLLPNRGGKTSDSESKRAVTEAERYIPWVREWSPEAMLAAQKRAEARYMTLFG